MIKGSATGNGQAATTKHNVQIVFEKAPKMINQVEKKLFEGRRVLMCMLPKKIESLMVNCYKEGVEYSNQSDAPIINGVKRDISFFYF